MLHWEKKKCKFYVDKYVFSLCFSVNHCNLLENPNILTIILVKDGISDLFTEHKKQCMHNLPICLYELLPQPSMSIRALSLS